MLMPKTLFAPLMISEKKSLSIMAGAAQSPGVRAAINVRGATIVRSAITEISLGVDIVVGSLMLSLSETLLQELCK